jgi:hypothetical protein
MPALTEEYGESCEPTPPIKIERQRPECGANTTEDAKDVILFAENSPIECH